jgi:hypothetical protein
MATVTDPTKSYEANIEAINGLRRFLRNNIKKPTAPPHFVLKILPAGNSGWGKATVVGG